MCKVILNMLSEIVATTLTVLLLVVQDKYVLTTRTWLQLARQEATFLTKIFILAAVLKTPALGTRSKIPNLKHQMLNKFKLSKFQIQNVLNFSIWVLILFGNW